MDSPKRIVLRITLFTFTVTALGQEVQASNTIKVSGGEDHTLVLTENKFVWACGGNYSYQLGTGNTSDQWTLIQVEGGAMGTPHLQDINDIAAGWMHSLALDLNSFVWSWGWNSEGQLGVGEQITYSSTPVQVLRGEQPQDANNPNPYLKHIIAISAGRSGRQSLGMDANNLVYAWGYNMYGQCGNDISDSNEFTPVRVLRGEQPQDVNNPNPYLKHIIAISAGADQSMALEKDDPNLNGCVYTWGTNRWGDEDYEEGWIPDGNGLLGTGSTVAFEDTPVKVHGVNDVNFLEHIVAIAAGWDHCMVLERDDPFDPNWQCPTCKGRVYTWGNNDQGYGGGQSSPSSGGRLGDGTTISRSTPVLVLKGQQETSTSGYLEHIVAIAAGEGHSMALDNNGNVYAWGDNQFGQLGNGTNDPCTTPVRVLKGQQDTSISGYLENIVAISAGHWHCIAVDADRTIWTWGKGAGGRLGIGTDANENTPQRVPVVHNLTQGTSYFRIQAAIDDANNGDILQASTGTFSESINFLDKSITLRSTNPNNWSVVENTIIDGSNIYSPIVTFNNNSGSVLNGFTVTAAGYYVVYCDSSSTSITNCDIRNNNYGIYGYGGTINITHCNITNSIYGDGIYCLNSNLTVSSCIIQNNNGYGINNYGTPSTSITNNIICRNGYTGIVCQEISEGVEIDINNNWIYNNYNGIYISNSVPAYAAIRNNTIVNNAGFGIYSLWAEDANISNCIIWGNNSGYAQLYTEHGPFENLRYCCIQNGDTNNGNINTAPLFYDDPNDPNNYHLDANSPCIDKGDPSFASTDETDIDGEGRVKDGDANGTEIVDIGADEFYWSRADFNGDGIVNFLDYAMLAWHWHETDVNGGDNDVFDLADNNAIDFGDILAFCDEWLWEGGFLSGSMPLMAGRGGAGMVEGLGLDASLSAVASAEREPAVAEPVDIEGIIKWLAEIWLDPEVREHIDAKAWLKFYESLNEL